LQCEVCGRQIYGKPHRVIIEGAKMTTCAKCAELGSGYWEPELKRQKSLTRITSGRSFPPRVSVRKRASSVPENLVVTENFGSIVRKARERLGLSHEDLGRKIKEKVSVIRKIETEKIVPDRRVANKLEHALGIKLLVPLVEPKVPPIFAPATRGVTLGEIVYLKKEKRRHRKNESNNSQS